MSAARIDPHNRSCPKCNHPKMEVLTTPAHWNWKTMKMIPPIQHNICPKCGHRMKIRQRY